MSLGEFELIQQTFQKGTLRHDVTLGVGDDCALVAVSEQEALAITVDTLVSGIHFFENVDPESLGHKALAVNLSDLAAMGADPAWCTLALTLPEVEIAWVEAFAKGFFNLASRHGVALIGGDTTRGPLSVTVQAMGKIPKGLALRRSGAQPGDTVWLSGPVGSAGLGLAIRKGLSGLSDPLAIKALEWPTPRIELGQGLRGIAKACIDVSDGLLQDLGHILRASLCGAQVNMEKVPVLKTVAHFADQIDQPEFAMCAGDDYELCFTADESQSEVIRRLLKQLGLQGAPIGKVISEQGLHLLQHGKPFIPLRTGYVHF